MTTTATLIKTENALERPAVIMQSHAPHQHYTTINIGRTTNEDGTAHHCHTILLTTTEHLTAEETLKVIFQHNLLSELTAEELSELVLTFKVDNYDTLAALLIASRYTTAEELAAHRKALCGDDTDLKELSEFAEWCKKLAKETFKVVEQLSE